MNIGDKIYVNDSIGEVIILDIQDDYLILFRHERGQFIKANGYNKAAGNTIAWNSGEYYNSLMELIQALEG